MNGNKGKFIQWLKRPKGIGLAAVYVFTAAAITLSVLLVTVWSDCNLAALSYVLFGAAAVSLGYTVYTLVIYLPAVIKAAKEKLKKRRFFAKMSGEYDFNTVFFAILSAAVNVAYAVINAVAAFTYSSMWYAVFAVYFITLVLFRVGVIAADRKARKKHADNPDKYDVAKIRIYLASGAYLVVTCLAMAAVITQTILFPCQENSGMIIAIASAAYTFYRMAMSIVNLVKARKFSDPVTQSLRNLNFANACMAMLSLTVTMISTFGDGSQDTSMLTVQAIVGFAACAVTLVMATVMIIKANKLLSVRREKNNEQ